MDTNSISPRSFPLIAVLASPNASKQELLHSLFALTGWMCPDFLLRIQIHCPKRGKNVQFLSLVESVSASKTTPVGSTVYLSSTEAASAHPLELSDELRCEPRRTRDLTWSRRLTSTSLGLSWSIPPSKSCILQAIDDWACSGDGFFSLYPSVLCNQMGSYHLKTITWF